MKLTAKIALAGVCAAALAAAVSAQAQPTGGARATLYELPNFQGRSITIVRSNDNLANSGFNDRAQSAHFDGDWTVCSDADFRGNCQTLSGDVANLNRYGLGNQLSSLQQASPGGYGANGYGRDPGDRGDRSGDHGDRGDGGAYAQDDRGYPGGGGGDHGYQGPGDRGLGGDRGYTNGFGPGGDMGRGGDWARAGGTPGRSVVFFARPQNDGQDIAAFDRTAADWFCRRQGLGAAVYYDTSFHSNRSWRFNGGPFAVNAPVLRDVVCRKQ